MSFSSPLSGKLPGVLGGLFGGGAGALSSGRTANLMRIMPYLDILIT